MLCKKQSAYPREILCLHTHNILFFIVVGSIVLSSSNYNAFEANGTVSVCAVIMAEALERAIVVQLTSQDSTATSMHMQSHVQDINSNYVQFSTSLCH